MSKFICHLSQKMRDKYKGRLFVSSVTRVHSRNYSVFKDTILNRKFLNRKLDYKKHSFSNFLPFSTPHRESQKHENWKTTWELLSDI